MPPEIAFLQLSQDAVLVGEGPFESLSEPPVSGVAFYRNDFSLSDPRPWKVPTRWQEASDFHLWDPVEAPVVDWKPVAKDGFATAFERITAAFDNGVQLEKLVPVVTETGRLRKGDLRAAGIRAFREPGRHVRAYGYWNPQGGWIGATPEDFMTLSPSRLETMALAGTASPDEEVGFRSDPKQIREQALVVEGIREALGGEMREASREVLELEGLRHFLTRLEMPLRAPVDVNALIRQLHPTPAVGYWPRTAAVSGLYEAIRSELGSPSSFAAPFGAWHESVFHSVVAIRQVAWSGDDVALPSGCGLIRESVMENEWIELALKRDAVKSAFGL